MGSSAYSKTIKVAVIDSGISPFLNVKLCPTGSKDFTGAGISDNLGHGTNVAGIISRYAGDADYCLLILKVFHRGRHTAVSDSEDAFKWAFEQGADIVNYSAGGERAKDETWIKKIIDRGGAVVVAAGNDRANLDLNCFFYPACGDRRVTVVGCRDCYSSNYGSVVDIYEHGFMVEGGGLTLTGTSMATAVVTGKLIRKIHLQRQKIRGNIDYNLNNGVQDEKQRQKNSRSLPSFYCPAGFSGISRLREGGYF